MRRAFDIFCLLELFTLRKYKKFGFSVMNEMRSLVLKCLKEYDEYNIDSSFSSFELYLLSSSVFCSDCVFKCTRSFVNYIKKVDKIK